MSAEEFNIECSDDEYKNSFGTWEPPAEVIDKLYTALDNDDIPTLKWVCPGYRAPSPELKEPSEQVTSLKQIEDKSDFDFMDETNTPKLKIRNKGEEALKGSAKKKTTSLDGVINNMRRHNLLPASQTGGTGMS